MYTVWQLLVAISTNDALQTDHDVLAPIGRGLENTRVIPLAGNISWRPGIQQGYAVRSRKYLLYMFL